MNILRTLALFAALSPGIAAAQTLPPGTVQGRLPPLAGPVEAIPFATLASQLSLNAGLVVGPTTTVVGDFAFWNNTTGSSLSDGGIPGTLAFVNGGTGVNAALAASLNATGGLVGFSGNIGAASGASLALSGTSFSIGGNAMTFPGTAATLAGLGVTQTWTAVQQFNNGNFRLLNAAQNGSMTLKPAAAVSTNTITFPAGTTDFSATGGTSQVVKQTTSGGAFTVAQEAVSDISGFGTGVATALGVNVGTAGAPVVNGGALGTPTSGSGANLTGVPTTALTGTLQAAQEPAHTGNVTNSAGSLALTIGASQVTNAMHANVAANSIPANATGSSAAPTDVAPAAARSASLLNVDSFTGHGDSTYSILTTDRTVGTNAAFTASRTWTLPAASAVNPGQEVIVADYQGTVTGTNTLVIARAGSDTVNGVTSVTIAAANGAYLLKSDGISKWTAQALGAAAAGGVSSVTCGTGLTGGTITTSGTCAVSLSFLTNAIGSTVSLNNTASFFDGPTVAQGTTGTWCASGTVTVSDGTGAGTFNVKLWDGTTVISSTQVKTPGVNASFSVALSGCLATPAGNIRMSAQDATTTNGFLIANNSGAGKDSMVTAFRIQ